MAIAKRNVSVSRGYKPKRARASKRGPNVLSRARMMLRENLREIIEFARDEIVYATVDTLHLFEYVRYALRRETRTRVVPVIHELETFVHEHEMANEVSAFAVEQVSALNVRTFKR
jgi:sugar-specific transcriptional regulator TrmB